MNIPSTISIKTVYAVMAQAVKDFPPIECIQPNTFTTITDYAILQASNLGKEFKDYKNGFFWSRHWTNRGANRSEMKFSYPIVGIEHRSFEFEEVNQQKGCHEFSMMFIDQFECTDCQSKCVRSEDQVSIDLYNTAMQILFEVLSYNLYLVEDELGEQFVWMSPGRYEAQKDDFVSSSMACREMSLYLSVDGKLNKVQRGLPNNLTAWAIDVKVCMCDVETIEFNYGHLAVKELATTKCSTCG